MKVLARAPSIEQVEGTLDRVILRNDIKTYVSCLPSVHGVQLLHHEVLSSKDKTLKFFFCYEVRFVNELENYAVTEYVFDVIYEILFIDAVSTKSTSTFKAGSYHVEISICNVQCLTRERPIIKTMLTTEKAVIFRRGSTPNTEALVEASKSSLRAAIEKISLC